MKTITLQLRNAVNSLHIRLAFLLISLVLTYLALSPEARAVCQQGCLTNDNTVLGDDALLSNTGIDNTAIGSNALKTNMTGNFNTAIGFFALFNNTIGQDDTAIGYNALLNNSVGIWNTAIGSRALFSNTEGYGNTATGYLALSNNTFGEDNMANGYQALAFNTEGDDNTAAGADALLQNTTGNFNTANGDSALLNNTTGSSNTAIGHVALARSTTGSFNIALGKNAGSRITTGSKNIDIGNPGMDGDDNKIRIGTTGTHMASFIAGISGVTVPDGVGVIVGTDGKLGTVVSSERFKDSIKPMDKASEAILALQPVTFHYKRELDPAGIPQFGLVAEEVEKVNPDLVARDAQGKPYTVRYEAVNAMLLNEFLKEHQTVQELKEQVAELTAGLQKVSAQLELSKPAPQTVKND